MAEELLPKPLTDLPLPRLDEASAKRAEKDLPAGRQELPSHSTPRLQGVALEPQNVFRNKIFIVFVVILFLVAFLIGGFALGKNSNNNSVPIPPPDEPKYEGTPIPEPTESPKTFTITKTATGKLLTETKYGLSFEYDNNLKECCGVSGPTSGEVIVTLGDIPDDDAGSDRPFNGFSVTVIPNPNNLTFAKYIDSEKTAFKKMGRDVPLVKSAINLGELSGGFLFKDSTFGNNIYYFPFPDGKNFISFGQTRETVDFDDEFVNILSTFKFTDSNEN